MCGASPVAAVRPDGSAGAGDGASWLAVEIGLLLGYGTRRVTLRGRRQSVLVVGWKIWGGGRVSWFNAKGKCPE